MSLQLRRSSRWWYGQFVENDNRTVLNLRIPVEGQRPPSINEEGDADFEASRKAAQKAHDERLKKIVEDRYGLDSTQDLVRMKTGREIEFPALSELADKWEALPRKKTPSPAYVDQCRKHLANFADWMLLTYKGVNDFVAVTFAAAQDYMRMQEERGISPKQYNEILKLLKAAYRRLHPQVDSGRNPFGQIPEKATETIHRRPFNPDELRRICDVVQDDDLMRPLVITGLCTAMRLGDCAKLRWEDVDLADGFIVIRTSKTGEVAEIPIVPLLRNELEQADNSGEYVFPELAKVYRSRPSSLGYLFKKVLIKAGLGEAPPDDKRKKKQHLPTIPDDELRRQVYAFLDEYEPPINHPRKPENMRKVFDRYLAGMTLPEITADLDVSRGSASHYLNEIEDSVKARIVNRPNVGVRTAVGPMRGDRKTGKRRASRVDFHSFRVTWITVMLTAGLPMELVRAVTGHQTVEIVLKHYFKPRRENLRAEVEKLMPKLLPPVGQLRSERKSVKELLAGASEDNAWEVLQRLKGLVE